MDRPRAPHHALNRSPVADTFRCGVAGYVKMRHPPTGRIWPVVHSIAAGPHGEMDASAFVIPTGNLQIVMTNTAVASVTVMVSTYNWKEALALALGSLAGQSRLPDEVIVADDGSREDTAALLRQI